MRMYNVRERAQETADIILATIRSEPDYRQLASQDSELQLCEYFERRLTEELNGLPSKLAERVEYLVNRRFARLTGVV